MPRKQPELVAKIKKHLKLLEQGRTCYKRAGDLLEEISDEMDPVEGIEIGPGKMAHLKPKSGKWVRFEPYEIEVLDV